MLSQPLLTPRLQLIPVTPPLVRAAQNGPAAFARVIGADAPEDWCRGSLALVANTLAFSGEQAFAATRAVAVHRDEGAVVGDVRFEACPHPLGEMEIGYSVAPSRRRQGYAVEATGAILDWLFAESEVETIVAGCHRANVASVRTLRRLGFWLDSTPASTFWWVLTKPLRSATRA
ncbi:MAG: GNAT family N-acetyltransferase [Hyphomonadaceae bacterium]|nr:GNAT family N-acetyltransferase [Hyphomonadaceae bacterium]